MFMRRGTGIYIVALVAIAAMLMLVSLYAELRQDLAHYARLAREDVESAREDLSLIYNTTSDRLVVMSSSSDPRAVALIIVGGDHAYVQELSKPIALRRGTSIDLKSLRFYTEIKRENRGIDRVCVLTSNLNLFCASPRSSDSNAHLVRAIEELSKLVQELSKQVNELRNGVESIRSEVRSEITGLESSVENLASIVYGSKYVPLLAKLLSTPDYLLVVDKYTPVGLTSVVYGYSIRYFVVEASFSVDGLGRYVDYVLTIDDKYVSSGRIYPTYSWKTVELGKMSKVLRFGNVELVVSVDVRYSVKKYWYWGKTRVYLMPNIVLSYTVKPIDSELYIVQLFNPEEFSYMSRPYTGSGPGVRAVFMDRFEVGSEDYRTPPLYTYVLSRPSARATEEGVYVYAMGKQLSFVYRFASPINAYRYYVDFGAKIKDIVWLYVPYPWDSKPYSTLVILLRPKG